jgi:hypothetical protein
VGVEHGEDEHARRWVLADELTRRGEPIESGHADVHEHDVGLQAPCQRHHLFAVAGLADDIHIILSVEDHPEPAAQEGWSSAIRTRIIDRPP